MPIRLRLDNIQGNITPGFRSDHQAFMLLRLPEGQAARDWLKQLRPEVASARQVATFLAEHRRQVAARPRNVIWVNVAFTRLGLERLGVGSLEDLPEDFSQGLYARARHVGDDSRQTAQWEVGGTREEDAHALVLLGARTADDLERGWKWQLERLAAHGGEEIRTYRGQKLPGELRHHEHFGFHDGVSQPDPPDPLDGWSASTDVVAPGEFILGYPDESGNVAAASPSWALDGSYLVFRRLRQDVFGFRRAAAREAEKVPLRSAHLAAKLVGRWPSGAKLSDHSRDPGGERDHHRHGPPMPLTDGDLANDPGGVQLPRFAHIRKANPSDLPWAEPRRHRLIRRGIPYGPPLAADAMQDDHEDRGLLFLAYQASLARQFEHIQQSWFNNADFPSDGDGPDPLVGQPSGIRQVRLRQEGGKISRLSLEQFVSVTAGGYFFAPSIRSLAYLAEPALESQKEAEMAYQDRYCELGEFIFEQNPYASEGRLRVGFQSKTETEDYPDPRTNPKDPNLRKWRFKDRDRTVLKAIWVEYDYRDKDGIPRTEHLLIGYAGGGN